MTLVIEFIIIAFVALVTILGIGLGNGTRGAVGCVVNAGAFIWLLLTLAGLALFSTEVAIYKLLLGSITYLSLAFQIGFWIGNLVEWLGETKHKIWARILLGGWPITVLIGTFVLLQYLKGAVA